MKIQFNFIASELFDVGSVVDKIRAFQIAIPYWVLGVRDVLTQERGVDNKVTEL